MLERTFAAFGTTVTLQLWPRHGGRRAAELALRREVTFLRHAERRLTRFDPDSELSRLNRAGGRPVRLSAVTFSVIEAALEAAEATGGLFDPTMHHALVAAGYDRSFRELSGSSTPPRPLGATPLFHRGVRGSPALQPSAPARTPQTHCAVGGQRPQGAEVPGSVCPPAPVGGLPAGLGGPAYRAVTLERATRTVTLPAGVALDAGGIAKGWLADAVVARLAQHGAALADLGGDIACSAPPPAQRHWEIEVEDPHSERVLGVLYLRQGGVATSGVTRRRWWTAGGVRHHLIDPRTGRPAEAPGLAAVTVAAHSATAAEVAAKVLLLLGLDGARQTAALTPNLTAVLAPAAGGAIVTGTGRARWQPADCEGGEPWRQAI